MRIVMSLLISVGILAGCSSDPEPKVVGTVCALPYDENGVSLKRYAVQHLLYDDGTMVIIDRDVTGSEPKYYSC